MKRIVLDAILEKLEMELSRLLCANEQSGVAAEYSAPNAEKQRDTTGVEAAYLASGYATQCNALAKKIEELKDFTIEDFTDQEIDVGALVEVEVEGNIEHYFLLNSGGGTEVTIEGRTITVITPETPVGKALMGNVEAGSFSFRADMKGIILGVC
jgi:hypothetical protein